MDGKYRNPPDDGRRAPGNVDFADGFDPQEITQPNPSNQELPLALDPTRHRIVSAHFFGLEADDAGQWQRIGTVADQVIADVARAMAGRAA